jgi:hypothetical protein
LTDRRLLALALLPLLLGAGPPLECPDRAPLRRPYFGDLHVHTTYSLDASTQGTRTTPDEAYRFARGERIGLHPFDRNGVALRSAQLTRPLHFAAVTDHAEFFGETEICRTPGLPGYDAFVCRVYRGWPRLAFFLMNSRGATRFAYCGEDAVGCLDAGRDVWGLMQRSAATANAPCEFTSFVGYEWTASGPRAANLHRNIIFRTAAVPSDPPDAIDAPTPEELWAALSDECSPQQGCEAVVIPHNSNISGALMFQSVTSAGTPLDRASAARRAQSERLVEIMQHKGSSECRASTAPADELCGFEQLPYDVFMGRYLPLVRADATALNFTRHALAQGLVLQQKLGANPFKFGIIASTDTHLGTPGSVAERGYSGHGGAGAPIGEGLPTGLIDAVEFNPGGVAVLWAEQNTRDALFAAMQRREVYGTSGPRIVLRMFGGWDLPRDLCARDDFAALGYASGVPMGGDLAQPARGAPLLAIWALADPGDAARPAVGLERIQIIKAWVQDGERHEAVVDVARSPAGDAGVDLSTCTPRSASPSQLCSVWRDPDFDPAQPALYYARVVEHSSCRWTSYACNAAGVNCADPQSVRTGFEDCCDPAYPRTIQERAWSSPIWYTPEN